MLFSVVFLVAAWALTSLFGSVGFIWARIRAAPHTTTTITAIITVWAIPLVSSTHPPRTFCKFAQSVWLCPPLGFINASPRTFFTQSVWSCSLPWLHQRTPTCFLYAKPLMGACRIVRAEEQPRSIRTPLTNCCTRLLFLLLLGQLRQHVCPHNPQRPLHRPVITPRYGARNQSGGLPAFQKFHSFSKASNFRQQTGVEKFLCFFLNSCFCTFLEPFNPMGGWGSIRFLLLICTHDARGPWGVRP